MELSGGVKGGSVLGETGCLSARNLWFLRRFHLPLQGDTAAHSQYQTVWTVVWLRGRIPAAPGEVRQHFARSRCLGGHRGENHNGAIECLRCNCACVLILDCDASQNLIADAFELFFRESWLLDHFHQQIPDSFKVFPEALTRKSSGEMPCASDKEAPMLSILSCNAGSSGALFRSSAYRL